MTASCLIKLDIEGNVLLNPNSALAHSASGYVIHGAIHAARHDVDCVIHTHTLSGMAVSAMKCGLLPIAQISMRWSKGVSYQDSGVGIQDSALRTKSGALDVSTLNPES